MEANIMKLRLPFTRKGEAKCCARVSRRQNLVYGLWKGGDY
jgi:hypothetical protein